MKLSFWGAGLALSVFIFLNSCVSSHTITYYDGIKDTGFSILNRLPPDFKIQKNDILYISVSSADPNSLLQYNYPNTPAVQSATGGVASAVGYLVDQNGMIDFPKLGKWPAAGFTKKQLADSLSDTLKHWIADPVITIRLINFRVTILGEVSRPGTYSVSNEKISLMEALGNAGDITLFGRKDNVLLVRETDSARTVVRINLNDKKFISSDYYYLKPNDYVYVEANKVRVNTSSPFQQSGPIIISTLSLIVVLIGTLTN